MLVGWFVCLIAMPIGGALRLLTIFVARNREKAWRWVAYAVPTIVMVATFVLGPDADVETDPVMATAMAAIIAFWTLIGSAFGAALTTRLVQGKPRVHKEDH